MMPIGMVIILGQMGKLETDNRSDIAGNIHQGMNTIGHQRLG